MSSTSTVFVVDDCRRVLDATASLLQSYGFRVETFDDPAAFLEQLDPDRPGVLLLDLRMPKVAGLDVLARMRDLGSELPVVFISAHAEVDQVVRAMKCGARDFLVKPARDEELVGRLQDAIRDDRRCREARSVALVTLASVRDLSRRELEVLDEIILGLTNREIADRLGISEKTVEVHRGRVIRKVGARNAVELTSKVLLAGYRPTRTLGSTSGGR